MPNIDITTTVAELVNVSPKEIEKKNYIKRFIFNRQGTRLKPEIGHKPQIQIKF